MKFFIDTHDHRSNTFPAGITKEQFQDFFSQYEKASREAGVVVLRAHEQAGLPFELITEVATATPGDLSFEPKV